MIKKLIATSLIVVSSASSLCKAKTSLALNAGIGSKMSLNKKINLDLAYKYVSLGKVKLSDASEDDTTDIM